ncbi:hypothetical protein N7474_000169 [Penicillium riverlandense]|uniref:uncharacterized protein n=1 Tax=Penicillium riverlandense TaxID=1903569 RepID=UPI00254912A5|nr:uncharacterized protein N7474_000169 [Penicillium riverlandense]KAJ5831858.1 hypothetical protein N7474_000169 [Penicillium riverlandense]
MTLILGLSAVVAISAASAAVFIVASVVGIVVWVRVRKERHALKMLSINEAQRVSTHPTRQDTVTELSREEGSALREYGQLPYGKPTEWGQLASRESLLRSRNDSDSSFPLLTEKARSLRNSLSRPRSKRVSRSSHKHRRLSSLITLGENPNRWPSASSKVSFSKDDVPLSAVEGALELPAERTPNQTPEIGEDDTGFRGMRPMSPAWPLPSKRDRSSIFPLLEDHGPHMMFDPPPRIFEDNESRRSRGASIISQTAGEVPDQPIPPPPPTARRSNPYTYTPNESTVRLSSISLDTMASSILEDSRIGPQSTSTDLTSPIYSSGGTCVPFSANDVGVKDGRRSFISTNSSVPSHLLPVRSSSITESARTRSMELTTPRRSMTERCSSSNSERYSAPPRRSESLSSNPLNRHSSLRSAASGSISGFHSSRPASWRSSAGSFVPQFSQCETVYESEQQRENDPFVVSHRNVLSTIESPRQNDPGVHRPQSPMHRSSLSQRGPPPSAMKSVSSQRKGHRRQNCVRISIHPPVTFGAPPFSPTVEEEPEDLDQMEEVDLRESAINQPPRTQTPTNTTSPLHASRYGKYGSQRAKLQQVAKSLGPLAEEPHKQIPSKKRKHAPSDSIDLPPPVEKDRVLPEILTSLPPSTGPVSALTHTPSPERVPPVWAMSENAASPISPVPGSPRRTAVKGPRSQPPSTPRSARSKSVAEVDNPTDLSLTTTTTNTSGPSTRAPLASNDFRTSNGSLYRTRTDARSYRRDRDSQDTLASIRDSMILVPSSPVHGNRVKDRVTIWEDATRQNSPPRQSTVNFVHTRGGAAADDGSSTPRSIAQDDCRPPSRMSSRRAPNSPTKRGLTTPKGKSVGLGIGATTPGSLYDGEGFLKE